MLEDRFQLFGFSPKFPRVIAENAHRHRDDGWRSGFCRSDVDSGASNSGRQRALQWTDQVIRVLALGELEKDLCIIGRGRLGSHREPDFQNGAVQVGSSTTPSTDTYSA